MASRCCSQWLLLASEKIGTQVRMKTFPGTQWGWFLSPLHFFLSYYLSFLSVSLLLQQFHSPFPNTCSLCLFLSLFALLLSNS